ncbi:MAG: hypothetical protein PQJ49_00115 [Sphaerochaetaceae bacterium]|nr:hypothetical protein [Sphaerochaetaceae bacterium]
MNHTLINDNQIRELLNPSVSSELEKSVITKNSSSLVSKILTTNTLDAYDEIKQHLTVLSDHLKNIFDYAKVPIELRDRQFLNKTGFAMSPANAITTIQDVFRVSGFIRAIDLAIKDLKDIFEDKPFHIVYPACGPLAPLLVPLLVYYNSNNIYSAKDIKVTFIDIQEGAVISLVNLLKLMQLDSFVEDIKCMDAVDYKSEKDIHLVVLEAMQHGFTKEGHLSISKHFSDLLDKDGIFLPQEVRVDAVLAISEEEYNTQWKDTDIVSSHKISQEINDKRIVLGSILKVNLETLRSMEIMELDQNTRLVKCATHTIPHFEDNNNNRIMLFTTNIIIYADETINEYDSGITHPLPNLDICINFIPKTDKKDTDLYLLSGDAITFYYKLVGLPGFVVTKENTK